MITKKYSEKELEELQLSIQQGLEKMVTYYQERGYDPFEVLGYLIQLAELMESGLIKEFKKCFDNREEYEKKFAEKLDDLIQD